MSGTNILQRPIGVDEFMPLVGQVLIADCTPKPAELVLVKIDVDNSGRSARVPFTLILRSPPEVQLLPGTYALRCGEFGPNLVHLDYVMPPADGAAGHYYQAAFN